MPFTSNSVLLFWRRPQNSSVAGNSGRMERRSPAAPAWTSTFTISGFKIPLCHGMPQAKDELRCITGSKADSSDAGIISLVISGRYRNAAYGPAEVFSGQVR